MTKATEARSNFDVRMEPSLAFVLPVAAVQPRARDAACCEHQQALRSSFATGLSGLRLRRARTMLPFLPCMSVAEPLAKLMTAPEELRQTFGAAATGEFTGFEASFDPESGAAMTVPNYYIPEEFVEW